MATWRSRSPSTGLQSLSDRKDGAVQGFKLISAVNVYDDQGVFGHEYLFGTEEGVLIDPLSSLIDSIMSQRTMLLRGPNATTVPRENPRLSFIRASRVYLVTLDSRVGILFSLYSEQVRHCQEWT